MIPVSDLSPTRHQESTSAAPAVSIVIVSFNVCELLAACLESVYRETASLNAEVFVVDNASRDGSANMVTRRFPRVRLIRNSQNRWLAPANNQALRECSGRFILFLNPDTELLPTALTSLIECLEAHPTVGIVGAQLLNVDRSVQPSGNALRAWWSFLADALPLHRVGLGRRQSFHDAQRDYERACEVAEASGACALVRRDVLVQTGPLDERFAYCYEDVDLCIRAAHAGWRTMYYPRAKVVHHGGRSAPDDPAELQRRWERGQLVFIRKHYSFLLYVAVRSILTLKRSVRRISGAMTSGRA